MRLRPARATGFTLTELLVVIGIIAVLSSIIGVVVAKARGGADKFRLSAQLQAITLALEAYRTDFQAFPTTTVDLTPGANDADDQINLEGMRGARLLCKALMGQCPASSNADKTTYSSTVGSQDGKPGFGFTVVGRSGVTTVANTTTGELAGKTYGPYLAPDKFPVVNIASLAETVNSVTYAVGDPEKGNIFDDRAVLLAANNQPVLYFPCLNPQAPVQLQYAYVSRGKQDNTALLRPTEATNGTAPEAGIDFGGTPMYRGNDNSYWLPARILRYVLGDTNMNGLIDSPSGTVVGEKPALRGKYILWTAGPDGVFGPRNAAGYYSPATPVTAMADDLVKRFDDVTNLND